MTEIAILGAGAFGTALAIALTRADRPAVLWARDADHAQAMQQERENSKRLPGARFPEKLVIASDIDTIKGISTLLLAIPTQKLREFLRQNTSICAGKTLIACCKGIELSNGDTPSHILAAHHPAQLACLTGPSFAHDIAHGMPTALTLACADEAAGKALQSALSTDTLRLYRSTDVTGAELGGALKNVMAIACGATMGAGLGESARAALITRGFAEMRRMALAIGAREDTLAGLSGFGDLVLTCTSPGSRNYRFGHALGAGTPFDPETTVEGAATAQAALARAGALGLDMPITQAVAQLCSGALTVEEAMEALLSRPLKEE